MPSSSPLFILYHCTIIQSDSYVLIAFFDMLWYKWACLIHTFYCGQMSYTVISTVSSQGGTTPWPEPMEETLWTPQSFTEQTHFYSCMSFYMQYRYCSLILVLTNTKSCTQVSWKVRDSTTLTLLCVLRCVNMSCFQISYSSVSTLTATSFFVPVLLSSAQAREFCMTEEIQDTTPLMHLDPVHFLRFPFCSCMYFWTWILACVDPFPPEHGSISNVSHLVNCCFLFSSGWGQTFGCPGKQFREGVFPSGAGSRGGLPTACNGPQRDPAFDWWARVCPLDPENLWLEIIISYW